MAIAAGCLGEAVLLALYGPDSAALGAAFALGVGLAVVYGRLGHDGEYVGLLAGGISPRRIIASVITVTIAAQAGFAAYEYAFQRADIPSAYIGYALGALQPVFIASSAFPICVRTRVREPWAATLLLLVAYVACVLMARAATGAARLGTGLYWFYVIPALAALDVALFRWLRFPTAAA